MRVAVMEKSIKSNFNQNFNYMKSSFTKFKMSREQFVNLLAIELLEKFGIEFPSQQEIDYAENQLMKIKKTLIKESN